MINGLALCTGGGGLEAGLHIVLPGYRTVCAVERQAYAAAAFVEWMEKTGMGACPVWDDVTTFDPLPWCGLVDILSAGYPCQPFSYAGKGLCENDPRHLWPYIIGHIRALMPAVVWLENVKAHLTRGFSTVRNDLERIGYRVTAGIFSAAEVGAPHLRERLFILGLLANGNGSWKPQPQRHQPEGGRWAGHGSEMGHAEHGGSQGGRPEESDKGPAGAAMPHSGTILANTARHGRPEGWPEPRGAARRSHVAIGGSGALADACGCAGNRRTDIEERKQEGGTPSCRSSDVGDAKGQPERAGLCPERQERFRSGRPGDAGCEELGNADGERLQGRARDEGTVDDAPSIWPWPAGRGAEQHLWEKPRLVKSGVGGTTHGVGARNEQLLMLGNGVVPVAAAMAFVALWEKMMCHA